MFNNKSTAILFTEICDSFFQGHQEYYIQYFDNNGVPQLTEYAHNVVPTYMVHSIIGEVVVADTGMSVLGVSKNDNDCDNIDILFQDSKRTRKIGVLFQPDQSRHFHVRWVAIEQEGIVETAHYNRDLHKDLSLIARRFGVKPNKVRVA